MIDLDFILADKPQIRRVSFYLFDTGVFKSSFLKKYRLVLEKKDFELRESSPETLVFDFKIPSLFGEYCLVSRMDDLFETLKVSQFEEVFKFLQESTSKDNKFIFVFDKNGKAYKALEEKPFFKSLFSESQVFTEAEKTKSNFKNIFQIAFESEFSGEAEISNFPLFKTSIEDFYFNHSENISDFFQSFNYIANTCFFKIGDERILQTQSCFDVTLFRSVVPKLKKPEYFKMHELVYKFLYLPSEATASDLYLHISEKVTDMSQIRLVLDSLYRTVFELAQIHVAFDKATPPPFSEYKLKILSTFSGIPLHNLFQFMVRFSELEHRFNKKDFLLSFHSFLQNVEKVITGV